MIAFIDGTIDSIFTDRIIITNNGIGYSVFVSSAGAKALTIGLETRIFTHFHVTESSMNLYGFLAGEEVALFTKLISVSGIGPKSALGLMDLGMPALSEAIAAEDIATITKSPGIGPKSAKRLVLELKDKMPSQTIVTDKISAKNTDALEVLIALGFSSKEAQKALGQIEAPDTETAIKQALKLLGK